MNAAVVIPASRSAVVLKPVRSNLTASPLAAAHGRLVQRFLMGLLRALSAMPV
jgi:hypothetical protein